MSPICVVTLAAVQLLDETEVNNWVHTIIVLEQTLGNAYEPPLLKRDAVVIWKDTIGRGGWRASC